jgi:hypothetical protein
MLNHVKPCTFPNVTLCRPFWAYLRGPTPKQNLKEFEDNNTGSTDRTLKKNFKAHFISWAKSSRPGDKLATACEILYQFMLKYKMVLAKGDVKELKREEVCGYKHMGEVFDEGWLSPKAKVNE